MGLNIYPVTIRGVSPTIHCLLSRPSHEERSTPTVVYFHALNGSRNQVFQGRYVGLAEAIKELGCNLFSVDLRAHGERRVDKNRPALENLMKIIHHKEQNPFAGAITDFSKIFEFLINKRIAHPAKIAVIGLAWGGMHAMYALKHERRLRCAVAILPVCKITSLVEFRGLKNSSLITQYEPLNYINKIAPKPLLMITGEKDNRADPIYASKLYEQLKPEYQSAGAQENLAYCMKLGGGHVYDPSMTDMVVDWLNKHLLVEEERPSLD